MDTNTEKKLGRPTGKNTKTVSITPNIKILEQYRAVCTKPLSHLLNDSMSLVISVTGVRATIKYTDTDTDTVKCFDSLPLMHKYINENRSIITGYTWIVINDEYPEVRA